MCFIRIIIIYKVMFDTIKEYAEKGLYIGIYPVYENLKYRWVAFVMKEDIRNWLKGDPKCSKSAFLTIENAYNAAIEFCQSYHEKKKKSK